VRALAKLVDIPTDDLNDLLWVSGLEDDEEDEVLLPGD